MRSWNEAEFKRLFLEQYGRVFRIVKRVLRSDAEAEEICAEAFWRLYQRGPESVEAGSAAGWLYRTATRAAIDELRAQRRHGDVEEFDEGTGAGAEDRQQDALSSMLRAEEIAQVRRTLAKMEESKAQILLLRHGGLRYAEIAEAMGMKASSVGGTLARAEAEFCALFTRQERQARASLSMSTAKEG